MPTRPRDPSADPWPPARAIVLAGGSSRRWGGRDKTAADLAGRPVLLHVIEAVLPQASALAVVAPADHPARAAVEAAAGAAGRALIWTREQPAGGGPVPGLAAGLTGLTALDPQAGDVPVVVLAGDLPFARTALPRLLNALAGSGADTALGVDPDGHRQPLLAAYRPAALARCLSGPLAGRPLRVVLAGLTVLEVPVSAREALDLDTPQAWAAATGQAAGR